MDNRRLMIWFVFGAFVAAAVTAIVAIVVATGTVGGRQVDPEPFPWNLKLAVVKASESQDGHAILTVNYRRDSREERISLTGPDVPVSYQGLVRPSSWSRPCSGAVGTEVLVAHSEGLPFAVVEGVKREAASAADAVDWRLCYVRLYFDLTKHSSATHTVPYESQYALGTSLGVISKDRTPVEVWIRGTAEEVLVMYDRPWWMVDAATRRGQPALAGSVQPIHDLRLKLQSRIILARVVPFRYESSAEEPVGGGWPYFVVALYEDRAGEKPVKVVDYSSDVR
jgi:hypothetical protein